MLEALFPARTTAEWLARLQREGVPAAPINTVDRVVNDPQVLLREMVVDLQHPTLGTLKTIGTPVKAEGAPFRPAPPPALGEHTEPVLRGLLGYGAERIEALRQLGVIV
jgi:crotonobetainyl-CoA:carnitine CoA-transferase CaiB-like acyl-CoA transferase